MAVMHSLLPYDSGESVCEAPPLHNGGLDIISNIRSLCIDMTTAYVNVYVMPVKCASWRGGRCDVHLITFLH